MPLRWRRIKQEYWADALLHKKLTAAQREFYQGLWMCADDLGWFRANVEEIGAELYRFCSVEEREADIRAWLDLLAGLGRIELLPCGHGFIPKLRVYQHLPAKDKGARTFWRQHQACVGGDGTEDSTDPDQESEVGEHGATPTVLDPRGRGGSQVPASARIRPPKLAGRDKESGGDTKGDKTADSLLETPDSIDGVAALVEARWRFTLSPQQRSVIVEIADRLGLGKRGFRRVQEILTATSEPDPIAALIAYDRRVKEEGIARARAQEQESALWRDSSPRSGGGFTSVAGRPPGVAPIATSPVSRSD